MLYDHIKGIFPKVDQLVELALIDPIAEVIEHSDRFLNQRYSQISRRADNENDDQTGQDKRSQAGRFDPLFKPDINRVEDNGQD